MSTSQMPTVRAAGREAPPSVLGRYRLGRRLGSGAFGTVHAGRDERLERDVAIKVLPRERIVGGRFEREARAAARLSHPAIVTLYEAAVDDDGAYLVSELVRGRTLGELLESGRLSDRDILGIGIALSEALAHAHEQGVIHRDLKPSNVLVPARPGLGASAKLTDFGVAHVVGGDSLTHTGDVIGTMAYMAPEQAEGRPAGPAADLYSLALVIYEALTGVNPLAGMRASTRQRRLAIHLPPLRRQRRDLPRALGVAIDQALRPRPSERGTLADLRGAMVACIAAVGEEAGVVGPGWHGPDLTEIAEEEPGPEWRETVTRDARAAGLRAGGTVADVHRAPAPGPGVKGLSAIVAALVAAWVSGKPLGGTPLGPAVVGLVAAVLVLATARLGWLVVIAGLATALALNGHAGDALLLAITAALSAAILLPCLRAWPLPAAAGALAVVGVTGLWPALAGNSRLRWWQRAALGGAGFVWVICAGRLTSSEPPVTFHDVVHPLLAPGAPAGMLICAAAASTLPWLRSGRRPARDLILVTVWAALTASALQALGPKPLTGLVTGAVAGWLIAAAPGVLGLARGVRGGAGLLPRLP